MPLDLKEVLIESVENTDHQKVSIYFECLSDDSEPSIWNANHDYHPASLIKLFVSQMAFENYLNNGSPANDSHKEILRAIEASLKESDNDALSFLVDLVSNTNSGTELSEKDLKEFEKQRDCISKFFQDKGCTDKLNIPNKCFSFDAYGRDQQLCQKSPNSVSVTDIATVMKLIKSYEKYSNTIFKFLKRDINDGKDYQTKFIAQGLKDYKDAESQVYSKAGWNSKVRHDAAWFKINGREYLLIILTKGLSDKTNLIPEISKKVLSRLLY